MTISARALNRATLARQLLRDAMLHAPTGGSWSFGQRPQFVAAGIKPFSPGDTVAHAEAVQHLLHRYFETFGPASVADAANFTSLLRSQVTTAVQVMDLEHLAGTDGRTLYDDRSRVIPSEYRKLMIRQNGDLLPTLLVDGYVAGVWRSVDSGIEATAFHPLAERDWDALAVEAESLIAFLADRDPGVYQRYRHWWDHLPAGEVRVRPASARQRATRGNRRRGRSGPATIQACCWYRGTR
jgi:hypothetical protein